MISIAMAYKNRRPQLIKTLESIESQSYKDIEVIIIDDGSDEKHKITDLKSKFPFVTVASMREHPYKNPCIVYNTAFSLCSGDIVIIQNPECLHVGELIQSVADNIDDSKYLSYACYCVREHLMDKLHSSQDKKELILSLPQSYDASQHDEITWYNHSKYRKVDFHFTTAITRKSLESLSGFDERFKHGMEYDDNEFITRVVRKGLEIVNIDDPFSIHQHHTNTYGGAIINNEYMTQDELITLNYNIHKEFTLKEASYKAPANEYYNCNWN